jgi:lipoprotein-anchoring transpeptidase ErfK/SrfK
VAAPPAPPPPPAAPVGLDARCTTWGKVVCVSKNARKVWLVENGTITMTLDARFGGKRTQTREGVFSVGWKSGNHKSRLYGSRMPYAMFFSRGQAIHFSSDFARRGWSGASHGCVNLRDKAGAAALFQAVPPGTKVVVYK